MKAKNDEQRPNEVPPNEDDGSVPWKNDEEVLLAACLMGNCAARVWLVQRYAPVIFAVARKVLQDSGRTRSDEWLDMVQDFLLRLYEQPARWLINFNPLLENAKLKNYLAGVAYNRFRTLLQRASNSPQLRKRRPMRADHESPPDPRAEEVQVTEAVRYLLAQLSDTSRGLIQDHFGVQRPKKPVKQIADELGISQSQVYRRIGTILRQRLRPFGDALGY